MGGASKKAPPVPDNSAAIAAQQASIAEQKAENDRIQKTAADKEAKEKAQTDDLNRRRRSGRRSLLGTEGDELGVV
jgi:hypothetical protein